MRLFIAIELPESVRTHLVRVRDNLRSRCSSASFSREENLHVTLKFLGETDPKQLPPLLESLAHVPINGPIRLRADRIECFPNRGPVRIVAAGFGGDLAALEGLLRSIEQRCAKLSFEAERRSYRPHVTLARGRPSLPGSLRAALADAAAGILPGPAFEVRDFVLMRSHLSSQGSTYELIARFPG